MKAIKNIMITLSGIALLASCDMDKFLNWIVRNLILGYRLMIWNILLLILIILFSES